MILCFLIGQWHRRRRCRGRGCSRLGAPPPRMMNMSIIVSLDPSSTIIGVAVYQTETRRFIEGDFIRPDKGTVGPVVRVESMLPALKETLKAHSPAVILIEVPTGRQYTREKGRTTALPVWAWAAGVVYGYCRATFWDKRVLAVDNQEWSRKKPKDERALIAAALAPGIYTPESAARDKGHDLADAIVMCAWWLDQSRMLYAKAHMSVDAKLRKAASR